MTATTYAEHLTMDNGQRKYASSAGASDPVKTVSDWPTSYFLYSAQQLYQNQTSYTTAIQAQHLTK